MQSATLFTVTIWYNNLCIATYTSNLKQCITQFQVVYIDQFFENNFCPTEEEHRKGNDLNSKNI